MSTSRVRTGAADTICRFIAISDATSGGLTMEHAIGALERELARESRPEGSDTPSPFGE